MKQDTFWLIDYAVKEASYGAGVANGGMTKWHELTGPGLFDPKQTWEDNRKDIKGHPYPTTRQKIEDRVTGSIEFKGNLDLLAFLIASMLAKVTTSGTNPDYTHISKWAGSGVDAPWSFSVIQASNRLQTTSFKKYSGVFPTSLEFSVEKSGSILTKCELVGDGSMADASAVAAPAINTAIQGTPLFYADLATIGLGPATESIATIFRKLTVRLKNEPQQITRPDKGTNIAEVYHPEDGVMLEVDLRVKGRKGDTMWGYRDAGTLLKLNSILQKSAVRLFQIQGNAVYIKDCKEDFEGRDHVLDIGLDFFFDATDVSPFVVTTKNGVAAYLV